MYLLLVGSMSCTSLLLRSARRALGNTGGNVTEAGDLPRGTSFVACVSGSSISAVVQILGREGKGREGRLDVALRPRPALRFTSQRLMSTSLPHTFIFLDISRAGSRPSQPLPPIFSSSFLSHNSMAGAHSLSFGHRALFSSLDIFLSTFCPRGLDPGQGRETFQVGNNPGGQEQQHRPGTTGVHGKGPGRICISLSCRQRARGVSGYKRRQVMNIYLSSSSPP